MEMDRAQAPRATLDVEFERTVRAPASARSAVAEHLQRMGVDGGLGQTAVLLVSEVVTNAVRHSSAPPEAPVALSATVESELVRIAVTDAGEGFVPRPRDPERLGEGYGLYLLDKAARSWGVEAHDAGTTVWFELDRPL
jgi:anti-sigma regulatory factor (Ser/Thr protein kinase)